MAYSVSQSDLVPMLAKCLLRHGSMEAVERYPDKVSKKGRDATVCPEFIALHEIRRSDNSRDLIQAAYEKAIQAATGALKEADAKRPAATQKIESYRASRQRTWVVPAITWLLVVGVSIWLEDEGTSPLLLASIVASAAYLLRGDIKSRKNKEREQDIVPNP